MPRSKSGKIVGEHLEQVGALPRSASAIGPTSDASRAPISPSPMPHASARGSWSPNARLIGPRTPSTPAGRAGSDEAGRDAQVAPAEQLDADGEEDRRHDPDQRQRRPSRTRRRARCGRRSSGTGSALRAARRCRGRWRPTATIITMPATPAAPARPRSGRERERQAAEEQRDEADPQGEADAPTAAGSGRRGPRRRRRSS